MSLAPGARLGPYEITAQIGSGGMGEVYRATDTNLKRAVAIKVLHDAVASDAERLARFQREAEVLASLNHPNIASIYGLERTDGRTALVLELVEGPTLADRIAVGPIPADEAIPIAKQIAEALEAAHDQGVVHRDLKPANIKIAPNGIAKVLDFGLAKLTESAAQVGTAGLSQPPTFTSPAIVTGAGVFLGTAAYMSPEQAKGRPVDKRSDVWAFGCVLFEMLTGRSAFRGEAVPEILASVLKDDVDWTALPRETSPLVRRLLVRCLQKDSRQRLRDIGDARLDLEEILAGGDGLAAQAGLARRPAWQRLAVWIIPVIAAVALLALGNRLALTPPLQPQPARRFLVAGNGLPRLSPDGARLVTFSGGKLLVHSFSSSPPSAIDGTDGGFDAFFSADGQWVAYFDRGPKAALRKVALSGGSPQTIAPASDARGGVWTPDDTIVFTPDTDSPLFRVSANGGPVERISTLDAQAEERSHRWPALLPGNRALLVTVTYKAGNALDDSSAAVLDTTTGKHTVLIRNASFTQYVPTGHLVYARRGTIVAVPFDVGRLTVTGPPVTILQGVWTARGTGAAGFSFSRTGDLAYTTEGGQNVLSLGGNAANVPSVTATSVPLVWVGRVGDEQSLVGESHVYGTPRITGDGRTALVQIADAESDIWAISLDRGTRSRLTFSGFSRYPVPSPGGTRLAYSSYRDGRNGLFVAGIDGSGERRLTATTSVHFATAWTSDNRMVIFDNNERGRSEVWMIRADGQEPGRPLISGSFDVRSARLSPDGRWAAFVSNESGRDEVYVREFTGTARVQVSTLGGMEPVWSSSGRELFFRNDDQLLAAALTFAASVSASQPKVVLTRSGLGQTPGFAVAPDGKRFLMPQPVPQTGVAPQSIHVMVNWFEELKRLVPTN